MTTIIGYAAYAASMIILALYAKKTRRELNLFKDNQKWYDERKYVYIRRLMIKTETTMDEVMQNEESDKKILP